MIGFLFKRVMIFCVVIAALSFIPAGGHPLLPFGIMVGGFLSIYKIRMYKNVLNALTQNKKTPFIVSFLVFMFILTLSFIILFAAIKYDIWLFFGIATGLVSTAAVICINALTERIGITHNNWREK